jgi:hypothetical protein
MFLDISSCFYLKHSPVYISKHNVSETRFCLRFQVKPTQLCPNDGASPYLRTPVPAPRQGIQAKLSINHLRELRQNVWGVAPQNYLDRSHHWRDEFSEWHQHKKNKFFYSSAVVRGVQMGEMSMLGWLIGWSIRDMWVGSLYFLYVLFDSARPSLHSNIFCGLLRTHVGLILAFQADPETGYICAP